jgi:sulfate permease, SulP family
MTEPAEARAGPGRVPVVLRSLRGYRRPWLAADVLAAVTLLAIAVPEQLATSRLAGMPPVTGFYAFVAGTVLFALLGSNPRMSVGADSTIAPLFAVGVARFATSGTPRYQELVAILAVMVGALVALVWLARLGWISDLLSAPIITGFLAGIAGRSAT